MNLTPPATKPSAQPREGGIRSDAENAQLLESRNAAHKSLSEDKIRHEHNIETIQQQIADALRAAKEIGGTDDLDALRAIVAENYRQNTEATDAYIRTIDEVKAGVAAIDAEAKASL